MAICKGCGAEIIWIHTPKGKGMPCNPLKVPYWPKEGAPEKVVTPSGEVVRCYLGGDLNKADYGYIPHWRTCPDAGRFRRRGRSDG